MTRTLTHLCLFVGIGIATAIGIAWGIALMGYWRSAPFQYPTEVASVIGEESDDAEVILWSAYPPARGCMRFILGRRTGKVEGTTVRLRSSELIEFSRLISSAPAPQWDCHPLPEGLVNSREELHFGWPLACMWSAHDTVSGGCVISHVDLVHTFRIWPEKRMSFGGNVFVLTNASNGYPEDHVPTGILWNGMAANTTLYATGWWLLLIAPGRLRKFLRNSRGLCTRCAYDLRSLPPDAPCPECGTPGFHR